MAELNKAVNTTNGQAENTKKPKVKNESNPIVVYSVYAMFFIFFGIFFVPRVWYLRVFFWSFVASFAFFNFLVVPTEWLLHFWPLYHQVTQQKRNEILNRCVSIVFNLSCSFHTYDLFFGMSWLGLPTLDATWRGDVWQLDLFVGWSIGYCLYDFLYLVQVYGETSIAILLHHCCEMLILTCYLYARALAGTYTISGALMLFSSAMLHVQRLFYFAKAKPNVMFAIKIVLLTTWCYGRLYAGPYVMYQAIVNLPMDWLHALLLSASSALLGMNLVWTWKIARRRDLAF